MKYRSLAVFFFLFLAATLAPLLGLQHVTVKEDIIVRKGEIQDNVVSFGGNVTVEGRVRQSIVVFGGRVILSGEVGDSVVGFGTAITLQATAVVKKDVVSLGGTLTKEPGCVIQGDTVYFKGGEILSKLFKGGIFSFPLIPLILILKLISFFIWLLIALVVAAMFPRQISLASSQIRKSFWPIVGVGLTVLILFIGLVIVFAFMSLILIGLPFLFFVIVVGLVIKIFGNVVLFYFFGESLAKSLRNRTSAPLAAVVLGLIFISLIKLIPILGFLFSFVLSLIGWGVVIWTKFGTTESWLRKKA